MSPLSPISSIPTQSLDTELSHEEQLLLACEEEQYHRVVDLIDLNIEVSTSTLKTVFQFAMKYPNTTLANKIFKRENIDVTNSVFASLRNFQGYNASHFAAAAGNFKALRELIDLHGIDINNFLLPISSPLEYAIIHSNEESIPITLLEKFGAIPRSSSNTTALQAAAYKGYLTLLKKLVTEYQVDINYFNEFHPPALTMATSHYFVEGVQFLLTQENIDININTSEIEQATALTAACESFVTAKNQQEQVRSRKILEMLIHNPKLNLNVYKDSNLSFSRMIAYYLERYSVIPPHLNFSPYEVSILDFAIANNLFGLAKKLLSSSSPLNLVPFSLTYAIDGLSKKLTNPRVERTAIVNMVQLLEKYHPSFLTKFQEQTDPQTFATLSQLLQKDDDAASTVATITKDLFDLDEEELSVLLSFIKV